LRLRDRQRDIPSGAAAWLAAARSRLQWISRNDVLTLGGPGEEAAGEPPKGQDFMVKIMVTDRDGKEQELDAEEGDLLMYVLRDFDTGVEGRCGGYCSCATCHVYVDERILAELPPISEDEELMLEGLEARRPNSRLSCQIEVSDLLEGAKIEVGEFDY